MVTAAAIKAHATELGFDLCGIAPATSLPELAYLEEWIDQGCSDQGLDQIGCYSCKNYGMACRFLVGREAGSRTGDDKESQIISQNS